MKCLKSEKLVKPAVLKLTKNHTAHEKRVWECELTKTEGILEGNLCNPFAVLMSLCDSDTKNLVESMNEFSDLKARLDTIALLGIITFGKDK